MSKVPDDLDKTILDHMKKYFESGNCKSVDFITELSDGSFTCNHMEIFGFPLIGNMMTIYCLEDITQNPNTEIIIDIREFKGIEKCLEYIEEENISISNNCDIHELYSSENIIYIITISKTNEPEKHFIGTMSLNYGEIPKLIFKELKDAN